MPTGELPIVPGPIRPADRLLPYRNPILAVRAAASLATIALAAPGFIDGDIEIVLLCAAAVGYSLLRIIYPIRFKGTEWRAHLALGLEATFSVIAVLATGYWNSPFVFILSAAIVVVSFARGYKIAVQVSLLIAVIIAVPHLVVQDRIDADVIRIAGQWVLWLVLLSLIAGYARRATGEAVRQHTVALGRLDSMIDANRLLHSLHEVAQTLPASLDLEEVIVSGSDRLTALFDPDGFALLVLDDSDGSWTVARRDGAPIEPVWWTAALPPDLRRTLEQPGSVIAAPDRAGASVFLGSGSALYAPLWARDQPIGLIVIETRRRDAFDARDQAVLDGFTGSLALAIDNARWFGRLRTIGADEERTRLARDLHDRIGQSIAFLAFELDRIAKLDERGEPLTDDLDSLRHDVRLVVGEMRETLYDLRTDLSESEDPIGILERFMERVAARSGIRTSVRAEVEERLPPLRERELWRIAQEAVTNAERHAQASKITIRWRTDRNGALVEIADDGIGFDTSGASRVDSYGIRGMRERASAIGAVLDIRTGSSGGTIVRCTVTDRTAMTT